MNSCHRLNALFVDMCFAAIKQFSVKYHISNIFIHVNISLLLVLMFVFVSLIKTFAT